MQPTVFDDVHRFWLGPLSGFESFNDDRASLWFGGARDGEIVERFSTVLAEAENTPLDIAALTPPQQVGAVLLFDQFPRSIFRNQVRSYAFDDKARAAARVATAGGMQPFKLVERAFLTMCFGHSEHVADQERASAYYRNDIAPFAPAENRFYEGGRIQTAKYLDIIKRFGRFPHRNTILGRQTSPEEATFLAETNMMPF